MVQLGKSARTVAVIAIVMLIITAISVFLRSSHRIKEVRINATIDPRFSYFVSVSYHATLDTFFCASYSLFGGRTGQLESLEYHPELVSGYQVVSFPINKLSPFFGCKWVPRNVSLCVQDKLNPRINGCSSRLFDVAKNSTVSPGIVIDPNASSIDKPIKFNCGKAKLYEGQLFCHYSPAPGADKLNAGAHLLIFPEVEGNLFPFDREDVYWLDIGFSSMDEEVLE